jgi:hypothetical protein
MQLIISSKGAGLAVVGQWIFVDGELPKREMDWKCWCPKEDAGYADFVEHCKTLI